MDWRDQDDGVLRILGGPYDGGEVDVEYIFAGKMPDKLAIGRPGPSWGSADYELDIDADGPYYRFAPLPAPALDPLPVRAERAERQAADVLAEAVRRLSRSRELREQAIAKTDALRRVVGESREARERVRRRRNPPK